MTDCLAVINFFLYYSRFFGEDPPPPPSSINWNVDKKPLALKLLSLCYASLENDMATPFQLCAIITPKLVGNLDTMKFSDHDKLKLTMDILSITQGIIIIITKYYNYYQ